jgi:hypothetical protein
MPFPDQSCPFSIVINTTWGLMPAGKYRQFSWGAAWNIASGDCPFGLKYCCFEHIFGNRQK